MHPGLTSSQARWNRCCFLGDVVHRCWLWPRAAPGPILGGCDLPELVPIWSEYVTEVVPFGVHAFGVSRSLCRVWSRRMRVLRCACLPPFAACLRLVLSACGRVACACSGPALSSCTGPVEQVEPRHNSATASLLAHSKFARSTKVLPRIGRRRQCLLISCHSLGLE